MHRGIRLIKIHFDVIYYVLGNACYIFNSSNKFLLQIHFARIIDTLSVMHFFSFRYKLLNTLKDIDNRNKGIFIYFCVVVFSWLFQGNIFHKLW